MGYGCDFSWCCICVNFFGVLMLFSVLLGVGSSMMLDWISVLCG